MESMIRVTTKDGEIFDLCRPESRDDTGWAQIYAIVGQAQSYEIIPQTQTEGEAMGKREDVNERDRCDLCDRLDRLSTCDCCGLVYCGICAAAPDGSGCDCPDEDCNLHPIFEGREGLTFDGELAFEEGGGR